MEARMDHIRGESPMSDAVNHPSHYRPGNGKIEVIEVIEAWDLSFHLGNVVKYVARAGLKEASAACQDLEKARWYLDREIALWKEAEEALRDP